MDDPKVSPDLAVSIVICLSWIFEYIPVNSAYFSTMFWLAMSLLQTKHIPMFSAAIALLENILKTADKHNCFENTSIENFFMNSRKENAIKQVLDQIDIDSSISYENSFSFAVTSQMLKGILFLNFFKFFFFLISFIKNNRNQTSKNQESDSQNLGIVHRNLLQTSSRCLFVGLSCCTSSFERRQRLTNHQTKLGWKRNRKSIRVECRNDSRY